MVHWRAIVMLCLALTILSLSASLSQATSHESPFNVTFTPGTYHRLEGIPVPDWLAHKAPPGTLDVVLSSQQAIRLPFTFSVGTHEYAFVTISPWRTLVLCETAFDCHLSSSVPKIVMLANAALQATPEASPKLIERRVNLSLETFSVEWETSYGDAVTENPFWTRIDIRADDSFSVSYLVNEQSARGLVGFYDSAGGFYLNDPSSLGCQGWVQSGCRGILAFEPAR